MTTHTDFPCEWDSHWVVVILGETGSITNHGKFECGGDAVSTAIRTNHANARLAKIGNVRSIDAYPITRKEADAATAAHGD